MRYEGSITPPDAIARDLNVEHIMEGTVRYAGDKVRITTRLIRASDNTPIWSNTYNATLNDIFDIQSDVALKVADAMQARLLPQERFRVEAQQTNSTYAYNLFLQTRNLQSTGMSAGPGADNLWIAPGIDKLNEAVAIDPEFSRGYAELAYLWQKRSSSTFDLETREGERAKAIFFAEKALTLDPNMPRAYDQLAEIASSERRWQDAQSYWEKALTYPDVEGRTLSNYAASLAIIGEVERAVELSEQAKRIEPGTAAIGVRTFIYTAAHDFVGLLRTADEMLVAGGDPIQALDSKILALYELGRKGEALVLAQSLDAASYNNNITGAVYVLAREGFTDEAFEYISRIPEDQKLGRLISEQYLHLGTGNKDEAFRILEERMAAKRLIPYNFKAYASLMDDPRMQKVVTYMNLPPRVR